MSRQYTSNLNLLTVSPDEPLTTGDLARLFGSNLNAIDSLPDLIRAVANAGYTPVQPVTLTGDATKVIIEKASTMFDIPALLASLPANTPVRITGFTMTLTSVAALLDFYDLLNTLYGVAADGSGLTKAQMHGTIKLIGNDNETTATGAQMATWTANYPSIMIVPQRIENKVYYKSYDGSELLHTETVCDNGAAAYGAVPAKASAVSGYMYSFQGWSTSSNSATSDADLSAISADTTVYAAYAYLQDVAPTLSFSAYSGAAGTTATATVTSFGSYSRIMALTALDASGNTITVSPGGGVLSVTESDNVTTVSVTPDSALFNATGWRLVFADLYGSCTRSVIFNLRNIPMLTVRKTSSGVGDGAVLDVDSWGAYPTLVSYVFTRQGQFIGAANGNFTLTPGDGLTVSGDVITVTPPSAYETNASASVTAQYLTFSNAGGDATIDINVNIFD